MAKVLPHKRCSEPSRVSGEAALVAQSVFAVLAVALLLGLTPQRAAVQRDNSNWQAFAKAFLDAGKTAPSKRLGPDTQAYALAYVRGGQKAALQQDLQTMAKLETFTRHHLDLAASQQNKVNCLAEAIYYEARNEPLAGQLAVAQVVLNRVSHQAYPSNICAVVFEGSSRRTGCQFSFTCDGSMAFAPRGRSWERANQSAIHAMLGMADVTIGRATHYHTVAVDPRWSATLLRTANIGHHIFYRFPSRREKALLGSAA